MSRAPAGAVTRIRSITLYEVRLTKGVVLTPVDYVVSNTELEALFASILGAQGVNVSSGRDQVTGQSPLLQHHRKMGISHTVTRLVRREGEAVIVDADNSRCSEHSRWRW